MTGSRLLSHSRQMGSHLYHSAVCVLRGLYLLDHHMRGSQG